MAEQEEVDPRYLWILPRHLKLKTDLTQQLENTPFFLFDPFDVQKSFLYFLNSVEANSMDGWLLFIPPGRLKSIQNERDVFCKKEDVSRINASVYFRRKMWLGSLQHVGLDVRGGLGRFSKLMDEHYDKGTLLPTTSIIVVDAEKASKYFDIGMQVSATPSYPQTLQEAAERYAQIAKLVEDANGTTPTVKELDKKIEEATDANVIWELKREKFRVQIKEKYKEMLLDMAVEERFEGELETIRERKRTRVGGG